MLTTHAIRIQQINASLRACPKAGEALRADSGRMVENGELCALELDYINEALVTQKQPGAGRFGGDLLTLMPYGNTSKL